MASRPKRVNPRDFTWPAGFKAHSHEIQTSGQPVQDGAQTLKSPSIQKEATRIGRNRNFSGFVWTSNKITSVMPYTYFKIQQKAHTVPVQISDSFCEDSKVYLLLEQTNLKKHALRITSVVNDRAKFAAS